MSVNDPTTHARADGFTLIELMITVAIVAILSAVATAAYTQYVRRAHLADGQKAMASAAVDLEAIFADKRRYPVIADFSATGTPDMAISYAPAADQRSFVLQSSGSGKMLDYFLAQNSADAKCKCEKCAANPLAGLVTTANACPAGALPW